MEVILKRSTIWPAVIPTPPSPNVTRIGRRRRVHPLTATLVATIQVGNRNLLLHPVRACRGVSSRRLLLFPIHAFRGRHRGHLDRRLSIRPAPHCVLRISAKCISGFRSIAWCNITCNRWIRGGGPIKRSRRICTRETWASCRRR